MFLLDGIVAIIVLSFLFSVFFRLITGLKLSTVLKKMINDVVSIFSFQPSSEARLAAEAEVDHENDTAYKMINILTEVKAEYVDDLRKKLIQFGVNLSGDEFKNYFTEWINKHLTSHRLEEIGMMDESSRISAIHNDAISTATKIIGLEANRTNAIKEQMILKVSKKL